MCGPLEAQHDPTTQDSVIDAAGAIQRTIANGLATLGPAIIAPLFAGLLATEVIIHRRRTASSSAV